MSTAIDATNAAISASEAEISNQQALASKIAIDALAITINNDAGTSSTKAIEANTYATDALTYLNNMLNIGNTINTSETNVTNNATNVLMYSNNASTSEANALMYSNNAAISATNAATVESKVNISKSTVSTLESNVIDKYALFDERMLGSKTISPILDNVGNALIIGAMYWDSITNKLNFWDGTTWIGYSDPTQITINGGTSSLTGNMLTVKTDSSATWLANNSILANGEIGFETDKNTFKIGDGITVWNNLSYTPINSLDIIGFENVDNIADINKPVSIAQETADINSVILANSYTDTALLGNLKYLGTYSATTNIFPITGGNGASGAILQGNAWSINSIGILGTIPVNNQDIIIALVDSPTNSNTDWIILAAKTTVTTQPYIISSFYPDRPQKSELLLFHTFTQTVTLPINLVDSEAKVKISAQSAISLTIKKNEIAIGSINFASSNNVGTFTFTTKITFNAGDTLEIYGANPADVALKQISITLKGTR